MLRKHPGKIDILDTGIGLTIGELWNNIGGSSAEKTYAFQKIASGTTSWIYSDNILPSMKYNFGNYSGTLLPLPRCIGGKCCWSARNSSGNVIGPYLYYTEEYGWIILPDYQQFGRENGGTNARFCGAIPIEYRTFSNTTTFTWSGDTFFSASTLPQDFGTQTTFTGRGGIRNDTTPQTLTLQWYWEAYERDDNSVYTRGLDADGPAGVYFCIDPDTGEEDDTEDRIALGLPQYDANSDGEDFGTVVRSLFTDGGHYSYSGTEIDIVYNATAGKWIIGEYNSPAGWYAAATEPNTSAAVSFEFFGPPGNTLEPQPDIVVTFAEYIGGNESVKIQVGDAARWHS